MKRNIIICLLMFFSYITLLSCNRNSKMEEQNTPNVEEELKTNPKSDKRNNTIVWCVLIISLFANAGFTMVCCIRMDERSRDRYDSLKIKLKDLNNNIKWENHQSSKPTTIQYKLSSEELKLIEDKVFERVRQDKSEKKQHKPISSSNSQPPKETKCLYAEAAGKDNMSFKVTEQPDEETIYLLILTDDNNANFIVYENAKAKVVACEDYLRSVCDIIGTGNNIESCEPGLAQKTSDGTWKVIKKANVKFV